MDKDEKIPKILAMYLPQFYETEDNNLFWGEGFTDWKAAQTAEKYFPCQQQPRVPLNKNYYDLSKKETLLWQVALAKEYGIDGFCFYHYYFKDGKMELELPAENLLRYEDIDINFCFDWDNSPWIRTWSKINGNIWSDKFDECYGGESREVLVEQDYESHDLWVRHFDYLLPFFSDERYIKIDDKPLFIIHYPAEFQNLREMIDCWNRLGEAAGLAGIYFIGVNYDAYDSPFDATLFYEPANSFKKLIEGNKYESLNGVRCFQYSALWESILSTPASIYRKSFFCAVTGYDNTPRVGRDGNVVINDTSQLFRKNFTRLLQKSVKNKSEFVFIDAWNEWGEGMYLEPDERYGYEFLQAVKESTRLVTDVDFNESDIAEESYKEKIKFLDMQLEKTKYNFKTIDKWMSLMLGHRAIFKDFMESQNVKDAAIYGMSSLGRHLLTQLQAEGVFVKFGIDRSIRRIDCPFKIYLPEDEYPPVDAIIVTAYDFVNIKKFLKQRYNGQIFILSDILDSYS